MVDSEGNPVYEMEEDGVTPKLDDDGNPIQKTTTEMRDVTETVTVNKLPTAPLSSTPLTGVKYIAAGAYTSAAVTVDGQALTWGANNTYQAGIGDYVLTQDSFGNPLETTYEDKTPVTASTSLNNSYLYSIGLPTPVQTLGGKALSGVSYVSMGENHGLAVLENKGEVYAWGQNTYGQTGTGTGNATTVNPDTGVGENTPVQVATPVDRGDSFNLAGENVFQGVVSIDAGTAHTLFARTDGFVFAAGSNVSYKLGAAEVYGAPSEGYLAPSPVQVGDLEAKGMAIYKAKVYKQKDLGDATAKPTRLYQFDESKLTQADWNLINASGEAWLPTALAQLSIGADEAVVVDYSKNETDPALVEVYLSGFNLLVNSRSLALRAADAKASSGPPATPRW